MIEVGKRIKEIRIDRAYSQVRLAAELNIHQTTLSKYENGEATPSLEILIKLVKILDTSADYILGIRDYE